MRALFIALLVTAVACRHDADALANTRDARVAGSAGATDAAGDGGEDALPASDDGGTAATGPRASSCDAEAITVEELHSGSVRSNVAVRVGPLLASSQKFLVSEAKSGSCLWGAFAADPSRVGPGSGVFVVSFGEPHRAGESCRPGTDGLPDDLVPGQELIAQGHVDSFVPAACARTSPARQLRVDAACPVRITGTAEPPAPALLSYELADELARGTSPQLTEQWGGALVRLENVSARQDAEDGDAVFPFGVVQLAETRLELRSRLYYFDLRDGGPRAVHKAPRFDFPTHFSRVTGVLMLDYCDWVLAPRDRCSDTPTSAGSCQSPGR